MRKNILLLIPILLCFVFFACKKDFSDEKYTPNITNPTKADLGETVTTSVTGFVTDQNDSAVIGATVTAGTSTVTTDKYGYFSITNATLPKIAGFIKVEYAGYFTAYKTFVCAEGKKTFTRVKLIPKTNIGSINSGTGGSVTTTDGAVVTLPANGVVVASGGAAYTGNIHVAAYWIDPTNEEVTRLNMPGDLRGVDTANNIKCLSSYGMLAVELTGDAGQLLQIAPNQLATLSFPIPSTLLSSAPATIPLWSFDETNGLWKEEAVAVKTGNNYVGNVPHFCYWNCDIPLAVSISFTAQLVDSSLHPLAYTTVEIITASGQYTGCHGYTDSAGFLYGYVPGNSDLVLNMVTPCGTLTPVKDFTVNISAVDLGTIKTTDTSKSITITGTLLNCASLPVANGYLIFQEQGGGNYFDVSVYNGAFSSTLITCSPGSATYAVVSFDYQTESYSNARTVILNNGINNLGNIKECTDSTTTTISYAGNPFCNNNANQQPVTQTGVPGGTYTATPNGLTIDPATGLITPTTSNVGVYVVSYAAFDSTINHIDTATTTVTVYNCSGTSATATISYASPFCSSDPSAEPVTQTGTVGGTYSSSAGLTINGGTGAITPSTSVPGTYIVSYSTGVNSSPAQIQVIISAAPSATISYATPFCSGDTAQKYVTMWGTAGGTYTSNPAGLTIHAATGAVIPSTSTQGNYLVTYTMAAAGGCAVQTATTFVAINNCSNNSNPPQYFNYSIDGNTGTISAPQDTLVTYNLTKGELYIYHVNISTQVATTVADLFATDSSYTTFAIHRFYDINGVEYTTDPNSAATVSFTIPAVGDYIYSQGGGSLLDANLIPHQVSVNFNVQRNQ